MLQWAKFLILQPSEQFSPHHHLLPTGSGLYLLSPSVSDGNEADKHFHAALSVFLNSPHPLEILSDRSAYGSSGNIYRDHDMKSYLKCIRNVIRQELNHIRQARKEHRHNLWLPLVDRSQGKPLRVCVAIGSAGMNHGRFSFSGIIQNGRESFKLFSMLVASQDSQHMHLLVVILFPVKIAYLR
ncbi:hypothetical protein Leryth_026403 [Lithospermum erythrorhizon]|nr:hypothetical protein Leryth_026403 [Lithospermum erythrorhizon]